ncbi:DUF6702 family protein [Idiomarina xiamenensis]|uniref:Orphan protein n=1 Tax=Idiomarina xiamenensis 10-D-4 TaxID=740709 RepID=K2KA06_9GAMM|nr:DUF6702 family protein [Idiomarina xiamenensis]EKE83352.1 hypothetical protein A10D4_08012 [Idiomarina xiamenensis 10-D-4]
MQRLLLVLALLFMGAGSAAAHQLKASITTILFNQRTHNIEVMQRYYLHDAEHAVKEFINPKADIVGNEKTRQQFSDYVLKNFQIARLDGTEIPLKTVGYEVDGPHFWVYQEVPIPTAMKGVKVRQKALQDLWPDQVNLVNVERAGDIQSVEFHEKDNWLAISF